MSFKPKLQTTYNINLSTITRADTHRDLGILVSSNLSWEPHYQYIIVKAYKLPGLLRRTFSTHNTISNYIYPLFAPSYCIVQSHGNHISSNTCTFLNKFNTEQPSIYIQNNFTSDYKTRLLKLQLLPLVYTFDLSDIMFFIKSYKSPHSVFNITN